MATTWWRSSRGRVWMRPPTFRPSRSSCSRVMAFPKFRSSNVCKSNTVYRSTGWSTDPVRICGHRTGPDLSRLQDMDIIQQQVLSIAAAQHWSSVFCLFGMTLTRSSLTMQLTSGVCVFAHVCGQKTDTSSNYWDNIQPCDKRRFSFCLMWHDF